MILFLFTIFSCLCNRCKLSTDQKHGKVQGILVWNGIPKVRSVDIGPSAKRQWTLVGTPDYKSFNGSTDSAYKLAPSRPDGKVFVPRAERVKPRMTMEA